MGEYAIRNSDEQKIKIGTCENMYYIRYEDRLKVAKLAGNLDCSKELGLFWRLPFPDEDHKQPGDYEEFDRSYPLKGFEPNVSGSNPGTLQMRHESGLMINVNCYHGSKLPESNADIQPFWNGKAWHFSLYQVTNTEDDIKGAIRCNACGKTWTCDINEITEFIYDDELKARLEKYAAGD
jgi:hypothetical protein